MTVTQKQRYLRGSSFLSIRMRYCAKYRSLSDIAVIAMPSVLKASFFKTFLRIKGTATARWTAMLLLSFAGMTVCL